MAIDPALQPGLEAFRRRDFTDAAARWGALGEGIDGDGEQACRALCRLAEALAAAERGQLRQADDRYAAARLDLEALPERLLGLDLGRLRRRLPPGVGGALASPPDLLPARRVPRRALVRFGIFLLLVGGAAAAARWTPLGAYLDREALLEALGSLRQAWWSPLLLVTLYALLCPLGLPATPLMVAGALVFGAVGGTFYNFLGTFAGALVGYWLARHLGSELLRHLAGRRLRRIQRLLERRGFWYLVGARFLPLPFPAVNFAMALGGIRFGPYALSTALGLVPTITVWTYFYTSLAAAAGGERAGLVGKLALALGLLLAVSLLPAALARRARRRRYREIRALRRSRGR